MCFSDSVFISDTNFNIFDYNPEVLSFANEIDPGQFNVRLCLPMLPCDATVLTFVPKAIDPNISAFAGPPHNGKVIHYVGWADQLISPGNSIDYYESVHRFMTEHTEMDVDAFYRLFMVGGMQHWYVRRLWRDYTR